MEKKRGRPMGSKNRTSYPPYVPTPEDNALIAEEQRRIRRVMTLADRSEHKGAIGVWTQVLDLIRAGTPVEGLDIIGRSNLTALKGNLEKLEQ
jgi:hypothetical protein